MDDVLPILKALGNDKRLLALELLRSPIENFPPQVDGDLIEHGVCGNNLATALDVGPSALSAHMRLLVETGLVIATRRRGWVFYRRDDNAISQALRSAANRI